jgi:hypothetical protein
MTSLYKQLANVFVINQSVIDAASSLCVMMQVVSSMAVPPHLDERAGGERGVLSSVAVTDTDVGVVHVVHLQPGRPDSRALPQGQAD